MGVLAGKVWVEPEFGTVGETLRVHWEVATGSCDSDWIGIYPRSEPDDYLGYFYAEGGPAGSQELQVSAEGEFILRYHLGADDACVASTSLSVLASPGTQDEDDAEAEDVSREVDEDEDETSEMSHSSQHGRAGLSCGNCGAALEQTDAAHITCPDCGARWAEVDPWANPVEKQRPVTLRLATIALALGAGGALAFELFGGDDVEFIRVMQMMCGLSAVLFAAIFMAAGMGGGGSGGDDYNGGSGCGGCGGCGG